MIQVLCVCVCLNSILYTSHRHHEHQHTLQHQDSYIIIPVLSVSRSLPSLIIFSRAAYIYAISCEESDDVKDVVSVVVVSSRIESPLIDVDNFVVVCSYGDERDFSCVCNCRNQRRKKIKPTAAAVGCQTCLFSGTRKPVTSLNPCCTHAQWQKRMKCDKFKKDQRNVFLFNQLVRYFEECNFFFFFVLTYPDCTTGTKHFQNEFRTIYLTTVPVTGSTGTDPIFRGW